MNSRTTQSDFSLLTQAEAAKFLGVPESWLQIKRLRGGGPTFAKLGRYVKYRKADLIAYVDQNMRRNTVPVNSPGAL